MNGRRVIRGAVFVDIPFGQGAEVDVRVFGDVVVEARADFEEDGVGFGAILEVVTVGVARFEAGAVAWPKGLFARVRDEHDLAF